MKSNEDTRRNRSSALATCFCNYVNGCQLSEKLLTTQKKLHSFINTTRKLIVANKQKIKLLIKLETENMNRNLIILIFI